MIIELLNLVRKGSIVKSPFGLVAYDPFHKYLLNTTIVVLNTSYSFMSDPQPPSQEPLSLEQKRIQSTREFLKMKRNLKKEEKNNQQSFTSLLKTIESNDHKLFHQELARLKPELVLHFLFSEDDLKCTPYQQLISHPQGAAFLQVLNDWALLN